MRAVDNVELLGREWSIREIHSDHRRRIREVGGYPVNSPDPSQWDPKPWLWRDVKHPLRRAVEQVGSDSHEQPNQSMSLKRRALRAPGFWPGDNAVRSKSGQVAAADGAIPLVGRPAAHVAKEVPDATQPVLD